MGMHTYIDQQVLEGEEVIYRAHVSWVPVIFRLIPFCLAGAVIGGAVWSVVGFLIVGILAWLLVLVFGTICQMSAVLHNIGTDIAITNKRLHSKSGIISVKENQASNLSRIDDTNLVFKSWMHRLFNYGDVTVNTLGDDDFYFHNIAHPRRFAKTLRQAKDRYANWGERTDMGALMRESKPRKANNEQRQRIPLGRRNEEN